jgi:hypothetical protein
MRVGGRLAVWCRASRELREWARPAVDARSGSGRGEVAAQESLDELGTGAEYFWSVGGLPRDRSMLVLVLVEYLLPVYRKTDRYKISSNRLSALNPRIVRMHLAGRREEPGDQSGELRWIAVGPLITRDNVLDNDP